MFDSGLKSADTSRQSARYAAALGVVLLVGVTVAGATLGGVTAAESQSSPVEISDWTDLQAINDSQATLSDDYVLVNDLNETTPGYDAVVANKTATEFSEEIAGPSNEGETVTLTRTPLDSVSAMSNGSSINVTITNATNGTIEFQEDTDTGNPLLPPPIKFDYTTTEPQFVGFVPIGTADDEFTGTLDGQGNIIANLIINRPLENDVAPFVRIGPGSKIKNVILPDVDVAGRSGVGGLVGSNEGTVSNVSASGSVTSSGRVGGLVGSNEGTVSNVSASMSVNPSNNAGGLVGDDRKIISNRSADKTVTPSLSVAPPAIGGLVGNNDGTVSESSASGLINGGFGNVGGLVGDNDGTVSESSASGLINGGTVGGLVGASSGTVNKSFATVDVAGTVAVGGLVGENLGTISNSSASGTVNGSSGDSSDVGGLVGYNEGSVSESFATGAVTGSSDVGGLIGQLGSEFFFEGKEAILRNSYYDSQTTEQQAAVGKIIEGDGTAELRGEVAGLPTSQMQGASAAQNMGALDFTNTWRVVTNPPGYPELRSLPDGPDPSLTAGFTITPENPIVGEQLTFDADPSTPESDIESYNWTLGDGTTATGKQVTHTYTDSGQFTVELTVQNGTETDTTTETVSVSPASSSVEISDWTDLDDIRNDVDADYVLVNDLNETTPGYETVAGPNANGGKGFDPIGGFNESFDGQGNSIANLTIDRPSENEVGLFRDTSGGAVIEEMILTGATVTGSDDVGGLVGSNSGTVSTSSVNGAVTGSTDVGGLVGLNDGTVSNSSTSGNVDGSNFVGGLVGYNNDGGGTVSESFATGAVTGSSDVGGLVGENFGTVTGAYWDTQATGQSQSAGGIGLNTSQMQGASAAQNMDALDFTNTWRVVTNPPGYPELRSLPDGPPPSGSKTLSVTAKNATGETVSGAELTLYTEDSEVVDSRQTNQNGVASLSTLTSGEYSVELYGPSGAFWGATAVTVAGNNTSATVQRTAPRLSQVTLAGDENGDGGYYGGRPVTVSPEIQNDGAERPVRVRIKLDTDNNDTHEQSVLRGGGGTSIPTGEIGSYGYEFDPETNGTKQVRVVTETEINDDWIVTDDSGWIKSFEIEHNIVGFEPLGTGAGVRYSNSTTDSFADGVQAGAALLPDGTSLSEIELPGTDYPDGTKNTTSLTESYPWNASGQAIFSFGINNLNARCSGAIIEDNHILTAGHCIENDTAALADSVFFKPGGTNTSTQFIPVNFVQTYKQQVENSNRTYDIAVLTMAESISSETGTFGYEAHSKDSPVYGNSWNPFGKEPAHLTGYPVTSASYVNRANNQWDIILQGEGTQISKDAFGCGGTNLCHDVTSGNFIDENTAFGQSGGPIWQSSSGKPTIISIMSGHGGFFDVPIFSDGIGVRITEKKHNDINEMIAHGYEQINESRPGDETPNSPPDGSSGSATGDPHLTTYDGVAYDFQAVGEFVLTNGSDNTPQVQARLRPIDTGAVSVISAVATQINGTQLTIDARDQQALTLNGTSQSIEPDESLSVENGEIIHTSEKYIVVYPGADGVVDDGDSRLEVTLSGDRLDASLNLNRTAVDSVSGLLGSPDGNASNDLVLANGTVLSSSPSFETLYGQYREDYRVTAGTSLFDYDDGESASGFFDPTYPSQRVTVDDFSDATRQQAIDAAVAAGLEPGTAQFRDAVIDYALTGNQSYLNSALRVGSQTPPTTDATPSETQLTTPTLTVDASQVASKYQPLTASIAATHPTPGTVTVVISNSTDIVYEQNVTGAFSSEQTISWNTRINGNGSVASAGNYTLSVIATTQVGVQNITSLGVTIESPTLPPVPGSESAPQDPDEDDLFEDIDGDGEFTIFDVQALFVNFESETVQSNPAAFNFNEEDPEEVSIFDVQALFLELAG